CLQGFRAPFTF
nr:immunoglobulin light chain junction region [Macaca mulatta]MOX23780.1 immunoglobulin light chain junction region [Macaca mulatta]MOX23800.1 immunoglobulin light chain junction region [Macaca mulatta]MOX23849.1 immunoglobulin light chain junction region [Macaca mulatta]MOX23854.1 immunoglobulin light chain junction region [Macaca mulatta]